ncbi:MAG TPA: cupredoxin domain-containing protein [Actinomycetes bacterium]
MSTTNVERRTLTWRGLALLALAVDLVLLLGQGVARRDLEALAIAAVVLLGAVLLRWRGGLAGVALLCLSFANLELWMLPAALTNAGHRAGPVGVLLPAALAAASLAGLAGGLGALARRRHRSAGGGVARRVGLLAVAAVAGALLVAAAVGPGPARPAAAGELALTMSNTAFHPAALAAPGGRVTVAVANHDLFWHSFTIEGAAVSVDVPVGGASRVGFTLPPGSYQFYCRVPGHRQAGMVGTLVVGG